MKLTLGEKCTWGRFGSSYEETPESVPFEDAQELALEFWREEMSMLEATEAEMANAARSRRRDMLGVSVIPAGGWFYEGNSHAVGARLKVWATSRSA